MSLFTHVDYRFLKISKKFLCFLVILASEICGILFSKTLLKYGFFNIWQIFIHCNNTFTFLVKNVFLLQKTPIFSMFQNYTCIVFIFKKIYYYICILYMIYFLFVPLFSYRHIIYFKCIYCE